MMERADKLYSMNGATLIQLADKLGVKVSCNRTRTQLKEKKENVVNRILEAENKTAEVKEEKKVEAKVEETVKAPAKEKPVKAKKETVKTENSVEVSDKMSELETLCAKCNLTTKRSSKKGVLFVYNEGRCVADIYFARKKVVLGVKVDLLPKDVKPNRIRQMGAAVDLEYSELNTLINIVARIIIPTHKSKKEEN